MYSYVAVSIQLFADSTTFAVLKMKEEYENLAVGFEECFQQVNSFITNPVVEIGEITYRLRFFMCCDYKVCR